jgi:hypothetical protein
MEIESLEKEDPELGFIARQIEQTGYPLEIHASEVLEKEGWDVLHSTFYEDFETRGMREIDIRADKTLDRSPSGDTINPYKIRLRLDIQCKKSDTFAWVFFLTPRTKEEMATGLAFLDYLYVAKTSSLSRLYSPYSAMLPATPTLSPGIAKSLRHMGELKLVNPNTFRSLAATEQAKTYKEIKVKRIRDSGSADGYPAIYEAAMTVLKATEFDRTNVYTVMQSVINGRLSGIPFPSGTEIGDIQLYMPIILFEGKLIAWQNGHLKNTDQVLLQSQVLSKGFFIPSPSIVVVRRDHLNDFLKSVDEDLLMLADRIHKNRGTLDEEFRLLTQQFASKSSQT